MCNVLCIVLFVYVYVSFVRAFVVFVSCIVCTSCMCMHRAFVVYVCKHVKKRFVLRCNALHVRVCVNVSCVARSCVTSQRDVIEHMYYVRLLHMCKHLHIRHSL